MGSNRMKNHGKKQPNAKGGGRRLSVRPFRGEKKRVGMISKTKRKRILGG